MGLFPDLPGGSLRPNVSHRDIGGRKPTFLSLSVVDERIDDKSLVGAGMYCGAPGPKKARYRGHPQPNKKQDLDWVAS